MAAQKEKPINQGRAQRSKESFSEGKLSGQRQKTFPIVGIGASAGGLEAFEKFFTHMPPNSGMAFVLVQHLDPTHESILVELVKRYTQMPVYQVRDGIDLNVNTVYVIPPNRDMTLGYGKLHLMEPEIQRGWRLPIDLFFRSLAHDQREEAICIILSGTGSDGTLGMKAIKGEGGMAMVQKPLSAKYDGMPRSALATGLVDYTLPVEDMPAQLMNYVKHVFVPGQAKPEMILPQGTDWLARIFIVLRKQTGHDFSLYKKNTIVRRIQRRMTVNQIERVEDYVRYLQQNPLEGDMLFKELLIGVTCFFRDRETFSALEEKIIPSLIKGRQSQSPLRIWVTGCSTGEEAYSIAILIREQMEEQRKEFKVQIFATDIDHQAIEKAREGLYPDSIAADVSPERLKHFFIKENSSYRIHQNIRDLVIFAVQSIIKDPPFSKLDLISCRNLLIYFGPELQKKVISLFHYALNPNGYMFMGTSESLGECDHLFRTIDRKSKLFQRMQQSEPTLQSILEFTPPPFGSPVRASQEDKALTVREFIEKKLLEHYAPSSVIINEKCDILYTYGRTGKYLEPATGEPSLNILRMAREGMKMPLTTAIRKVTAQKENVAYEGVRVKTNGDSQTIRLTVRPILRPASMQGLMMVTFEDMLSKEVELSGQLLALEPDQRILELEQELKSTKEYLQTTIEELETSNEELKATNEELQSSNEELQSTNEELETSKEELQSVNEELMTVNSEHQNKIEQLRQTNEDMNNLLAAISVGTIYLDNELCIQRFTPAAMNVINLIPADIGRPLAHIASNLIDTNLVHLVNQVLDTLEIEQKEVQSEHNFWYWMEIRPYRTVENAIDGVLITFTEITRQKRVEQELRRLSHLVQQERNKLRALLDNLSDHVWFCDAEGNLLLANRSAAESVGVEKVEELSLKMLHDLSKLEMYNNDKQLRPLSEAPLSRSLQGERLNNLVEIAIDGQTGQKQYRLVNSAPFRDKKGQIMGAVATVRDITELKRAEMESDLLIALNKAIASASGFDAALEATLKLVCQQTEQTLGEIWLPDHDSNSLRLRSISYLSDPEDEKLLRFRELSETLTLSQAVGFPERLWANRSPEWISDISSLPQKEYPHLMQAQEAGLKAVFGIPIMADGDLLAVLIFYKQTVQADSEQLVKLISSVALQLGTVLLRKQAEEALRRSEERFRKIFEDTPMGMCMVDEDYRFMQVNRKHCQLFGYSEEELLELTFIDLMHPDDVQKHLQLAKEVFEGQRNSYQLETRYITKQEKIVWAAVTATLIRDKTGKVRYGLGMINDITQRKWRENQLAYQISLLEHVSDAVITTDLKYGVSGWNKAAESIYGWQRAEAIGKSIRELVQTKYDDQSQNTSQAEKALLTTGKWQGQVTQTRKDGSLLKVNAVITLLKDIEGNPMGVMAVNRHIGEHKPQRGIR